MPLAASPFIGSFLGVLIRRLPTGRPVALARSACEQCGRPLRPAELVPLISFVVQRGRCRGCGATIAPMHLAIELAAIAVAALSAAWLDPEFVWAGCVLGWTLLALAWIDMEWLLLPDSLTLPLLTAGLITAWLQEPWAITDRAIGAIIGYLALRSVEIAYRKWRGRDGLGQGDAKLLAASGAWLGWPSLPWVLVIASSAGLLVAGGLVLVGRKIGRDTAMPFGPSIAAATWALWLAAHGGW